MKDLLILKILISLFILALCAAATPKMDGSRWIKNLVRFFVYMFGFLSLLNLWFPAIFGYVYTNYYH